jgi:hypothetical protein
MKNKMMMKMVNLPLCLGTKGRRNTKGADERFVEINVQPSKCPKQMAGVQDTSSTYLSERI